MHTTNAVLLTDEQTPELRQRVGTGRESNRKATRARILLRASQGETDEEIAESLDVGITTVQRTRRRFAAGGLNAALQGKPHRRGPDVDSTATVKPNW